MKANPFESQLERLARTLTEQFGVQVVCQGDNAWTDGRQIVLPTLPGPLTRRAGDARSPALDAPRPPTADSERACSATAGQGPEGTRHASGPASQGEPSTEDLERLVIGYLDHEMAHVAFSDFQVAAEFSRKHRGFEGILNVVEDALIERLAMQRWPGVRRNLDRMFEQIRPRVRRLIQQRSPFDRFCTAVYLRLSHHQDIMGLDAELAGFGDLLAQFPQIGTTQQAADLAEQILRRWQQQAPGPRHQPQPSPDTQPDAQAETTPESGSPTPAEQGSQGSDAGQASSGASEGANDDSAAPGGDPSGDSAEPGAANAESRQRSGTRGDQEAESTDSEPASRQAPGTHGGQDGETAPAPASDTPHGSRRGSLIGEALTEAIAEAVRQTDGDGHYRVFTKAHDRIELVPAADAAEAEALLANGRDAARRLRRGLTNALRSAEKRWWRHDQLRGELSPRSLYRLATDRPRLDIFRVRSVVQGQSTAVSILLDASGSMSRRKMEVARSALAVLLQALGDLGVATEALTFTTGNAVDIAQAVQQSGLDAGKLRERYGRLSNLEIGLVKAFAEPVRPALARLPAVRGSGLTPLGEGMQIAAARLVVRRENRRILLVLTDGKAGCEGSSESARRHAQAMAERIMRAGIELIGVGILDENIREVVAESIVIQKIEDLPAQLCKLLGRTLKKGLRHVG